MIRPSQPCRNVVVIGIFVCLSAVVCRAAGNGQIQGVVQTLAGAPVPGANVYIMIRQPAPVPFHPFNTQVTTAADGTFSVTGVPAGSFAVCPVVPNSNLLAPCLWGTEPTVTLTDGQSVAAGPIQLNAGVDLDVRVNDPNGTAAAKEGKVPGASLLLGIRLPNTVLFTIPKTASDPNGFDYHLTVPGDTDLELVAFSKVFAMTDSNGKPIDPVKGLVLAIHIPPGQKQHKEVINIQ